MSDKIEVEKIGEWRINLVGDITAVFPINVTDGFRNVRIDRDRWQHGIEFRYRDGVIEFFPWTSVISAIYVPAEVGKMTRCPWDAA